MAIVRRSLSEARKEAEGQVDFAKLDATTEEDIRRHMVEDGEEPDSPFAGFTVRGVPAPAAIRKRLGLSQESFAKALRIPIHTLRNWEQGRTVPDPSAQTLLRLVSADPDHAFKVLGAMDLLEIDRGGAVKRA